MIRHLPAWMLLLLALSIAATAQTLPTGVVLDTLAAGLDRPVAMAFLRPDGGDLRMVVAEQGGRLLAFHPSGNTNVMGMVPGVDSSGYEQGLLGVAAHPSFGPGDPYIYVFFTHLSGTIYISRFTVTGDLVVPTSLNLQISTQYDIVVDLPDGVPIHNGGTLRFGPDRMLYASVGEDGAPCDARDPTTGRGAILRLDVLGLPAGPGGPPPRSAITPPGNPFPGTAGFGPLAWAHGLRNPFRFVVDDQGDLIIGDVGAAAWEEINVADAPGMDFGWPLREGPDATTSSCPGQGPFVAPVASLSHTDQWVSLILLDRYRCVPGGVNNLPAYLDGQVLFQDFYFGRIHRLAFDGVGWITPPPAPGQTSADAWITGLNRLSDAATGPDGGLYLIRRADNFGGGTLRRLRGTATEKTLMPAGGRTRRIATAGVPLWDDLGVTLLDGACRPIAGSPVTFAITSGKGTLGPSPVMTDAQGNATVPFVIDPSDAVDAVVTATAPGAAPTALSVVWRGLLVATNGTDHQVSVHLATPSTPFTLAVDVPRTTPWVGTPSGPIWTSLGSAPTFGILLDGLGAFGPPDPSARTGAGGTFSTTFTVPFLGISVLLQAYADDPTLTGPARYVFTNPVIVNL